MRFLDTNIIIRFLSNDDPPKARACLALFERIERGEEQVRASVTHIAEVCFVLASRRGPYRLSHDDIRGRLLPILKLPGVKLPNKRLVLRALDSYATFSRLDFEDALAVAIMEAEGMTELYSYDTDFDGVAGMVRLEPPEEVTGAS